MATIAGNTRRNADLTGVKVQVLTTIEEDNATGIIWRDLFAIFLIGFRLWFDFGVFLALGSLALSFLAAVADENLLVRVALDHLDFKADRILCACICS